MKKVLFLFFVVYAGIVLDACRCKDVHFPYYDFQAFSFTYPNSLRISSNSYAAFTIQHSEVVYYANNSIYEPLLGLSFAYGTQPCPTDGYLGLKYHLDSVQYFTLNNFDSTHLKGSSIIDIVKLGQYNVSTGVYDLVSLPNPIDEGNMFYSSYLGIETRPSISDSLIVEVVAYRNNNTVVRDTTELFLFD